MYPADLLQEEWARCQVNRSVLVCGTNWLGDSVMMMPALQLFKQLQPENRITMLVKPKVRAVWDLHADVDEVLTLEEDVSGTFRTASMLRAAGFNQVYIAPHSIRSSLIPCLARIPIRVGVPGPLRGFLTTHVVTHSKEPRHQAYEYLDLFGIEDVERLPDPVLDTTDIMLPAELGVARCITLIPSAARGPSKQWPAAHFIEVGKRLAEETGRKVVVMGGPGDGVLCQEVADGVGGRAVSIAGKTDVRTFIASLARSSVVITNDSGGMHLSPAVGVPVVGVFGLTDPSCTGPLGERSRVVQAEGVHGARDIARDSDAAREALASISPERVLVQAREIMIGDEF